MFSDLVVAADQDIDSTERAEDQVMLYRILIACADMADILGGVEDTAWAKRVLEGLNALKWRYKGGGIMFGLDRASKKRRLEYVTTESVQLSARPPLISSSSYLDRLTPHCVRRVARSVHLRVAGCSGGLLGGRWTIGVPSRALRGNEITLSAQVVRKFSLEDREDFQTLSGKMADCFAPRFSAHGSGIQITAEVGIDPASYLNRQYQRRVRAPSVGTELRGRKLRKLNATGTELQTPVALEGARCMS